MARTTVVRLVDDIDGGNAAETLRFAVDGVSYEIDLSEVHAKELRAAFAPYVEAGRKQSGMTSRVSARVASARATDRVENYKIRAWAQANGKAVADRGRIPQGIIDEYRAAA